MRILFSLILTLSFGTVSAGIEKDLNLGRLKKAYHWLASASEDAALLDDNDPVFQQKLSDLTNTETVWDMYKSLMKSSITIIRKYPKRILEKLSALFQQENSDILPLVAFYLYSVERKDQSLRYYDAFHTNVVPGNQDNLWIALIPFTDVARPSVSNYSILILDVNNQRVLTKD